MTLQPSRLMVRFLVAAVVLFIFFISLSYAILKNNSNRNLNQYFHQIYTHTMNTVSHFISENEMVLETLSALPQFQAELRKDLERYQGHLRQEYQSSFQFYDEIIAGYPDNSTEFILDGDFNNEKPLFVRFVSPQGITLSGDRPEMRYKPFPHFKEIKDLLADGKDKGIITAAGGHPGANSLYNFKPLIYFIKKVSEPDGFLLGYLVSEFRTDILLGPGSGPDSEPAATNEQNDAGIYSLSKEMDQFLIDQKGRPVSFLLKGEEYSELLNNIGYSDLYSEIPLVDPIQNGGDFIYSETSNISVIIRLLSDKTSGLIRNKSAYRNYTHQRVDGAAFWIEQLNLGLVVEINAAAAFSPYMAAMGLILFILALSFSIFLYFVLWINRLRIQALDANPLTQLPGNRVINKKIESVISENQPAAVVYGDLDNFKAFNDTYGFSMGDKVIQFTADVIRKVISSSSSKDAFCGHIGGDDFIFIVSDSEVEAVSRKIGQLFEQGIVSFYTKEHLESGFIEEKNREGIIMKYPVMSFSMAGIILRNSRITHYLEVATRCGELKKLSKKTPGSTLVLDKRKY